MAFEELHYHRHFEFERPYQGVVFIPRVGAMSHSELSVEGILDAARLESRLEAEGHKVSWSTDNGFASTSYLTERARRDMDRAKRLLGLGRRSKR